MMKIDKYKVGDAADYAWYQFAALADKHRLAGDDRYQTPMLLWYKVYLQLRELLAPGADAKIYYGNNQ